MSIQKTAEEIESLLHHDPDCLSWSYQKCDCDYCEIASALTQLGTRALVAEQELAAMKARVVYCYQNHNNLEQEAERLRKALKPFADIWASHLLVKAPLCGFIHHDVDYENAYKALAPQSTEAQEETGK